MMPSPEHASQRPPFTLKEKRLLEYPRILASCVAAKISRISVKTPVYVAGFERGVRPMGDWSISITLSRYSMPSIPSCLPARVFAPFNSFASLLYIISFTSELLPEPDTPVIQVNVPSGIFTSMPFRLFSRAPFISRKLPFPVRRFSGSSIFFTPDKYWPVIESAQLIIVLASPSQIILPP